MAGEAYFQADRDPLRYFWLLLVTAQFERAIEFLNRRDPRLAVHFAIPLQFYGLVRCSPSPNAPVLAAADRTANVDGDALAVVLNFALVVQRFVRPLANTQPLVALRYYFLLR
jgi:hypothetical protein